ncbi:hypothetical protein [uncultured Maribacter sp.]|uniref:hypothetical protein n=1 Tax=uncultured Maribacter sp. TaxID=431308 RepID=UPI00262D38F0|nr:hypothetical protein [uncultured Maribacter sp.]
MDNQPKLDLKKVKIWFESLPEKRKYEIHQATRMTYHSCSIEGNSLTENDTFNLIVQELYKQEIIKT